MASSGADSFDSQPASGFIKKLFPGSREAYGFVIIVEPIQLRGQEAVFYYSELRLSAGDRSELIAGLPFKFECNRKEPDFLSNDVPFRAKCLVPEEWIDFQGTVVQMPLPQMSTGAPAAPVAGDGWNDSTTPAGSHPGVIVSLNWLNGVMVRIAPSSLSKQQVGGVGLGDIVVVRIGYIELIDAHHANRLPMGHLERRLDTLVHPAAQQQQQRRQRRPRSLSARRRSSRLSGFVDGDQRGPQAFRSVSRGRRLTDETGNYRFNPMAAELPRRREQSQERGGDGWVARGYDLTAGSVDYEPPHTGGSLMASRNSRSVGSALNAQDEDQLTDEIAGQENDDYPGGAGRQRARSVARRCPQPTNLAGYPPADAADGLRSTCCNHVCSSAGKGIAAGGHHHHGDRAVPTDSIFGRHQIINSNKCTHYQQQLRQPLCQTQTCCSSINNKPLESASLAQQQHHQPQRQPQTHHDHSIAIQPPQPQQQVVDASARAGYFNTGRPSAATSFSASFLQQSVSSAATGARHWAAAAAPPPPPPHVAAQPPPATCQCACGGRQQALPPPPPVVAAAAANQPQQAYYVMPPENTYAPPPPPSSGPGGRGAIRDYLETGGRFYDDM